MTADKITHYFTLNNLSSESKFGFVKGRSTVLQLSNLKHKLKKSYTYDGVDIIYTDFEKAFDKVSQNRLLFK